MASCTGPDRVKSLRIEAIHVVLLICIWWSNKAIVCCGSYVAGSSTSFIVGQHRNQQPEIVPPPLLHIEWRWYSIRQQPQSAQAQKKRTVKTTRCALFTNPTNWKRPVAGKVDGTVYQQQLLGTQLPWIIDLKTNEVITTKESSSIQPRASQTLSIRWMELKDLESIVTMNLQEYGSGPAYFPITNPSLIVAWIDRLYLTWLIDFSCRMKLLNYYQKTEDNQSSMISDDHAILVGVLHNDNHKTPTTIIGMIEVSLQVLNPLITPQAIPFPLSFKRALATITTPNTSLVGWITNLLIIPSYRGFGYSKLLVMAAEQVATTVWNCTSIHLHCDADVESGSVPQKLYTNLGYRSPPPPTTSLSKQSIKPDRTTTLPNTWYPPYQVEIEGVQLLYLCKDLSPHK
jgi:Acetyltransferase (GNAT) family